MRSGPASVSRGAAAFDYGFSPARADRAERPQPDKRAAVEITSGGMTLTSGQMELRVGRDGRFRFGRAGGMDGPTGHGALWEAGFETAPGISAAGTPFDVFEKSAADEIHLVQAKDGMTVDLTIKAAGDGIYIWRGAVKSARDLFIPNLVFPGRISFPVGGLKRMYYPKGVGLYIQPGFFKERRSFGGRKETMYPSLFSDFVRIEHERWNLAVYTVQNADAVQPASLDIEGQGGEGMYRHAFPVYVGAGKTFSLPAVKMDGRSGPMEPIYAGYAAENKLTGDGSLLSQKIPAQIFDTFARSIMIKADFWKAGTFESVRKRVRSLPPNSLVHPVSFWPKGFDQNYPDYLPTDPRFGRTADFQRLNTEIRQSGRLAMPYTNPTWWNESPTMTELGPARVSVLKKTGEVIEERYGANGGWVISPSLPAVVARHRKTLDEFTAEVPSDILFEDQLAAREYQIDWNPAAPGPVSYMTAVRDIARRTAARIPTMTEGAWDALVPYEAGFCNVMGPIEPTPRMEGYDRFFGQGNWRFHPGMLFWANSRVRSYPHNLAPATFLDSLAELTWSLVFAHGFVTEITAEAPAAERMWIDVAAEFASKVGVYTVGKNMTRYEDSGDGVIQADYPDGSFAAWFGAGEKRFGRWTLPPDGFLFRTTDNRILAGVVSGADDAPFDQPQMFLMDRSGDASFRLYLPALGRSVRFFRHPFEAGVMARSDAALGSAFQNGSVVMLTPEFPERSKWRRGETPAARAVRQVIVPGARIEMDVAGKPGSKSDFKLYLARWRGVGEIDAGSWPDAPAVQRAVSGAERISFAAPENIQPGDILLARVVLDGRPAVAIFWRVVTPASWTFDVFNAENKIQYVLSFQNRTMEPHDGRLIIPPVAVGSFRTQAVDRPFRAEPVSIARITGAVDVPVMPDRDARISVKSELKLGTRTIPLVTDPVIVKAAVSRLDFRGMNTALVSAPISGGIVVASAMDATMQGTLNISLRAEKKAAALWTFDTTFTILPYSVMIVPVQIPGRTEPGNYTLEFVWASAGGKITARRREPIVVFAPGRVAHISADVDDDGETDEIMANDLIEAVWTRAIGGRLLDLYVRSTRRSQLYRAYPDILRTYSAWDWSEYGGANDWFPRGWPGLVWNNDWTYRVIESSPEKIRLSARTKIEEGLILEREMSLVPKSDRLDIQYSVENAGAKPNSYVWSGHPDVAPGGSAGPEDAMISGDRAISFRGDLTKDQVKPTGSAVRAADRNTGEFIEISFPADRAEWIGMWNGRNFFSMEPIFREAKLDPGQVDRFQVGYRVGVTR